MRPVSRLANLLVVLAAAAGGPQWYALESGVQVPCAARDAISVGASPSAVRALPIDR